jgi:aminoglycoside adenylyltransferase-like protein/nucleotidyltransferase-like protein
MFSKIYPELPSVLERFLAGVQNALGTNFVGLYLVGSLATGDFDLDSDVDFLVVTNIELSGSEVRLLQANHIDIHALGSYPAQHLEGSYISRETLRRTDLVAKEPLWYLDNGSTLLKRSVHDNQWHVRWILRERGIALAGPDPKTLLDIVRPEAIRGEIVAAIKELESRFAEEIDRPQGWFKMRFGQSFTVLTCSRMLHTWQTGTVQSKRSAANWAEESLGPEWRELIQKAWAERTGVRFGDKIRQPAETQLLQETAQFLAYARTLCNMS